MVYVGGWVEEGLGDGLDCVLPRRVGAMLVGGHPACQDGGMLSRHPSSPELGGGLGGRDDVQDDFAALAGRVGNQLHVGKPGGDARCRRRGSVVCCGYRKIEPIARSRSMHGVGEGRDWRARESSYCCRRMGWMSPVSSG